jgi:TPR repeat protein
MHQASARQVQEASKAFLMVSQADKLRFSEPCNPKKAAELYKKAAALGNASGQFNYGQMILRQEITDQPPSAALPWLLKAAAQPQGNPQFPGLPNVGVKEACVTLGDVYRDCKAGLRVPDYAAAISWYRKAAEMGGCALAQNNLGHMYQSGMGVQVDMAEAVAWYGKAAEQGYGVAELNLASLLYSGKAGVQQDLGRALELARKAHSRGTPGAAALLSQLEPSTGTAVAKLREAAKAGDPEGCFWLALAHLKGLYGLQR